MIRGLFLALPIAAAMWGAIIWALVAFWPISVPIAVGSITCFLICLLAKYLDNRGRA